MTEYNERVPTLIERTWKRLFAALPKGLTTNEIKRRLGKPLRTVQYWVARLGYKAADPKGWIMRRQRHAKHRRWKRVDWSKTNIAIAKQLGISREAVRQMRKKGV